MTEVTCFTLWMLLAPLVYSLQGYINHLEGREYTPQQRSVAALLGLILEFTVGCLLYRLI